MLQITEKPDGMCSGHKLYYWFDKLKVGKILQIACALTQILYTPSFNIIILCNKSTNYPVQLNLSIAVNKGSTEYSRVT